MYPNITPRRGNSYIAQGKRSGALGNATPQKTPCKGNRQFEYTITTILLPLQGEPSMAAIVSQGVALGYRLLPLRGEMGFSSDLFGVILRYYFLFFCENKSDI